MKKYRYIGWQRSGGKNSGGEFGFPLFNINDPSSPLHDSTVSLNTLIINGYMLKLPKRKIKTKPGKGAELC